MAALGIRIASIRRRLASIACAKSHFDLMKKHFLILLAIISGLCVWDARGIATINLIGPPTQISLPFDINFLPSYTLNLKIDPIQFDSNPRPIGYFTWGITKNATATAPFNTLPYGLTLNQIGVLSGMPTKTPIGTYSVNVCTFQKGQPTIRGAININVKKADPPEIEISLPITQGPPGQFNLPEGKMDVPYVDGKGGYIFKAIYGSGIPFFLPSPGRPTGYNWSLSWGKIPTGMTFNTVGALSGIPVLDRKLSGNFTQPQTFTFNITATDAVLGNDTKTFSLKINPPVPPTIVTDCPLPDGLELYPYANVYLKATSGKKEYKWSVGNSTNPVPLNAINRFPDGLILSSAGTIYGKPTLPGLFVFRLKVTDANGLTAEKECRITIIPAPIICTDKLFECASVGDDAGCFQMCAKGGGLPYTWSATGLPPALTINSTTGKICGNFTQAGNFTANITVRESFKGNTASKSFPIVVKPKLEITTISPLPWGIVGRGYPYTSSLSPVKIEAKGGWPPYKMWKVVFGKLPDGLTLDPDSGIIGGTPILKGSYKFTVQVIDSCGKVAFKEFIIDIYDPITLPTPPIPCLTVNKPFSTTLTASGGKGVLSWQVTSPSSSAFTVTPTGEKTATLAGTPSDSAPLAIVVLVTDENGYAEEFTLNYSEVNAPLVITTNCPLPAGEVDKPYSAQLTATGGKQPYTWEILPQIYVADFTNNKIRKFYEGGIVKTYAGNGINQSIDGNLTTSSFNGPYGMAFDAKGNLYVADRSKIRKISFSGNVTTLNGTFSPEDMVADDSGNVYVGDAGNYKVRKIDPLGNVTDVAGNGTLGFLDGNGTLAKFYSIQGICWDLDGNIILTDQNNHSIRKITIQGNVSTIAGRIGGYQDGNVASAQFNGPHDVKVHHDGTIYVLDHSNGCIRKISKNGIVSTLGTKNNLTMPYCLSVDNQGFVYVSDGRTNHNISKISPNGNVTVIAGGGADFVDNIEPRKAKFNNPRGVEINPYEDLPLGWTLNPTTGGISGTQKKHGLYNITYRVTDACGNSAIKECQITIAPAPLICSQTLSLPCLSKKPISLQIVADNDFAVFAGNSTTITRKIYQNLVGWDQQIVNAASLTFDLLNEEDTYYILAIDWGGPADISGKINGVNIADLVSNDNNKIQISDNIYTYLSNFPPISLNWGNIESAKFALNNLNNDDWSTPNVKFDSTVLNQNPYAHSNKFSKRAGLDFPISGAVFFRFSVADVGSLPDTTVLTVSGGVAPYTWLISGNLPTGLEYKTSPNGDSLIFYGSFAESGSFPIVVTVTDAAGTVCSGSHTIVVYPKLEITNSCPLANGTKGIFYSQSLTATGGKPSYTWALVPANTGLPPGLALNSSTGLISGTPTATGNFTFTYKIADGCGTEISKNCTITVVNSSGPALDCFAHMSGLLMSDAFRQYWEDVIYNSSATSSIVGAGDHPSNQIAFPNAIASTFDSLAIGKNVRVIIYSGPNFTGSILLDQQGPALIFNSIGKQYQQWVDVFNKNYTDITLKNLYPLSRRFWSSSNMHEWVSGSTKVICSNNFAVNASSAQFIQNSDGSLPPDYLEVGKNYDSDSLRKLNTGPLKFATNIFLIQKNEVTISEYNDFLNAIAKVDVNGLYSPLMANHGIKRSSSSGSLTYLVESGSENYPVTYVSWLDAARYANWLANGKPTGAQSPTTTENGVYNLEASSIVRNAINPNTGKPPTHWLLNESEWYTSAHLKSDATALWAYPTQSNTAPDANGSNPANLANFGSAFEGTTPVGFFDRSPGPFGTFDQAGNVREWTESLDTSSGAPMRIIRGGSWADPASSMRADESHVADPTLKDDKTGFRIGGAP